MFSIQATKLEGEDITEEGHTKAENLASIQLLIEVQFSDALQSLLMEFKDLFAKPTSLPPNRNFDHSIHLKPNSESVNIRFYQYPPIQKTKIERLEKNMLAASLI